MYYSKNNFNSVSVPRNYSGSAFRTKDAFYDEAQEKEQEEKPCKSECKQDVGEAVKITNACEKSDIQPPPLLSFLSGLSVEDLLLLGLIFVIHQDSPTDPTLLILLILLLAK